jgi:hypothetical protein
MEMSQGNSLCSYLKQAKSENRRAEQVLWVVGVGTSGRGRRWGKGGRGIWCKCCAYRCENGKMRPVETAPGMGEGDKGGWWRSEFKCDTL